MKERTLSLTPREISLLRLLADGGLPRKEAARITGISQPELTRLVKALESKGIVAVRRRGVSSSLTFSETKHASVLRSIVKEFGHMRLEGILSLASLRVISSLAVRPSSTRTEILEFSDISPRTLQTVLGRLRGVGVLRIHGRGIYELSDRFEPFADFARELMSFSNQKKALAFSPDSAVIWERGPEFMLKTKTKKEHEDFKLTAFSAFDCYGVPLVLDLHYYYHPPGEWRRTVDEVLLQSMLVRPRGTRENTAILMLWEKNSLSKKLGRIREGAARYGLENETEQIAAYFQDPERDRPSGFPRMRELREKMGGR